MLYVEHPALRLASAGAQCISALLLLTLTDMLKSVLAG